MAVVGSVVGGAIIAIAGAHAAYKDVRARRVIEEEKGNPGPAGRKMGEGQMESLHKLDQSKTILDSKSELDHEGHSPPNHITPGENDDNNESRRSFMEMSKCKKIYYDQYPSLNLCGKRKPRKMSLRDLAVNELTETIMSQTPSGDPADRHTLLHILHNLSAQSGMDCYFYDSSKNIKPESKHDEESYLHSAYDEGRNQFILTLNNLRQFTSMNQDDDEKYDEIDIMMELEESIKENNRLHPLLIRMRDQLGDVLNFNAVRIEVQDIFVGSANVVFSVTDLSNAEKERLMLQAPELENKMREMFNDYQRLGIHPLLLYNTYDVSMFDERGNKTFKREKVFQVGPSGQKKAYTQPNGWVRYGLDVLGKYDNGDDKWLHPFGDDGNWYRSFHGTKRAAGSSIYENGFRVSNGQNSTRARYGPGVYNSPDIAVAQRYAERVTIQTTSGPKTFYFALMVAVNPSELNKTRTANAPENYWIAPSPADIRAYGILIKPVNGNDQGGCVIQ